MANVLSRNVVNNIATKFICILFSRLVIKKLNEYSLKLFRILEKELYKYEKLCSDFCFMRVYSY